MVTKLGKALRKHNYSRIYKNKSFVYLVNLKEYEEVDRESKLSGDEKTAVNEQQIILFRFDN